MRYRLFAVAGVACLLAALPVSAEEFHHDAWRAYHEHWRSHPEEAEHLARAWHERFFHGPVEVTRINGWAQELRRGVDPHVTISHVLGGPEYYTRCGGTAEKYVHTVFTEVVGRAPTPAEHAYWAQRLYHESRAEMALALLNRYPPTWVLPSAPVVEVHEYRPPVVIYRR
jgi:hypothetical protein